MWCLNSCIYIYTHLHISSSTQKSWDARLWLGGLGLMPGTRRSQARFLLGRFFFILSNYFFTPRLMQLRDATTRKRTFWCVCMFGHTLRVIETANIKTNLRRTKRGMLGTRAIKHITLVFRATFSHYCEKKKLSTETVRNQLRLLHCLNDPVRFAEYQNTHFQSIAGMKIHALLEDAFSNQ